MSQIPLILRRISIPWLRKMSKRNYNKADSAVWVYTMLCLIVCRYDKHNIPQQQDTPTEPTPVQEPAYADAQTPTGGNT